MGIASNLIVWILLVTSVIGRVRRQGTLEGLPVLPFSAQLKPGDESQTLEVQNENAEKGIVDNKDTEVEEVLEYVEESDPGADPDAELDQMNAVEEPGMDDENAVGRVILVPEETEVKTTNPRSTPATAIEPPEDEKQPLKRNQVTWIVMGVLLFILLLAIVLCICLKYCRKRRVEQPSISGTTSDNN